MKHFGILIFLVFFFSAQSFIPNILQANLSDDERPETTTFRKLQQDGWQILSLFSLDTDACSAGDEDRNWRAIVMRPIGRHSEYFEVTEMIVQPPFSREFIRRSRQFK